MVWFRSLIQKALNIIKNNNYPIDSNMPINALAMIAFKRSVWALRGIFRLVVFQRRIGLLFLGPGVEVRCHSKLKLGNGVTLDRHVLIDALSLKGVNIGNGVSIGRNSIVRCTGSLSNLGVGFSIGAGSGIDAYAFIGAAGGVRIGENVIMGQHVSFHSENHRSDNLDQLIKDQGTTRSGIEIGDNCWIGSNVTILDGCRVGSGCVLGAGSVVIGVIPENSIVVGVPGRVVRTRGRQNTN
jgi:acetyltransferase-like isoleucine patch superfamily enzyme